MAGGSQVSYAIDGGAAQTGLLVHHAHDGTASGMISVGRANIVAAVRMPADVVTIGSTVTYRDETIGQEKSVTLVYPEMADMMRQRVSVMKPIGVALLALPRAGHFTGTRVQTSAGC
jgi:hypothetical protein